MRQNISAFFSLSLYLYSEIKKVKPMHKYLKKSVFHLSLEYLGKNKETRKKKGGNQSMLSWNQSTCKKVAIETS